MPIRKRDTAFARRHFWNAAIFGVPFIICLIVGMKAHEGRDGTQFLLAWGIGVAIAIIGFVRQQRQSRRYRCPECGAILPYATEGEERRIQFHCQSCDIIWDSGMMEGND